MCYTFLGVWLPLIFLLSSVLTNNVKTVIKIAKQEKTPYIIYRQSKFQSEAYFDKVFEKYFGGQEVHTKQVGTCGTEFQAVQLHKKQATPKCSLLLGLLTL